VTDKWTDVQTDRQTDRQTLDDSIHRVSIASRGKCRRRRSYVQYKLIS